MTKIKDVSEQRPTMLERAALRLVGFSDPDEAYASAQRYKKRRERQQKMDERYGYRQRSTID